MANKQLDLFTPLKSIDTITAPAVLNTDPAFGFMNESVPTRFADFVRARSDIDDHSNFSLIKRAYRGYYQVEVAKVQGIPQEILQQLNTVDILALYIGIQTLKGEFIPKAEDLIGAPLGKLISALVAVGYVMPADDAATAVHLMNSKNVGFSNHRHNPPIEQRINGLSETTKVQFLRAFYTPKFFFQEYKEYDVFDTIYMRFHSASGLAIDSNDSRDAYAHAFVELIKEKQHRGNDFNADRFTGRIVQSESTEGLEYFVQRNIVIIPEMTISGRQRSEKRFENYNCSCPHGYRKMYAPPAKKDECKHIAHFRKDLMV